MNSIELVVTVDEAGNTIGSAPNETVHTDHTPLHLAFSCYLLNSEGMLLMTRRALTKRTWPGVWTNSFCGHPGPGEACEDAIVRRSEQELGCTGPNPGKGEVGSANYYVRPHLATAGYVAVGAIGTAADGKGPRMAPTALPMGIMCLSFAVLLHARVGAV